MASITLIIVLLLQCLLTCCDEVLRFQLTKQEEVSAINDLAETMSLDFWQLPSVAGPTDVYIEASGKAALVEKLRQLGVSYEILIPDVAKLIEEERRSNLDARRRRKRSTETQKRKDSVVGYFARYQEVIDWINKLSETVPIASVFSIGQSYEGRDLRVLKLSTGSNRSAVFFNSALHAREWLTVAAVNYMIEKLIKGYNDKNQEVVDVLSKVDLYILPIANPDGYEYSFTNFRLWRKTRQPWGNCTGTDPNRNFAYHFGGNGSSSKACSFIYRGPEPFSEPETAAMRDFILKIRSELKAYVDVHCCAQMWLMPWSYTKNPPRDIDDLTFVADQASKRMEKVNDMSYPVGSPAVVLYPASGTSYDWVKGVAGVKFSYTIELWSNKRRSRRGFVVPVSLIGPSGEETYAGIMTVAKEIFTFPPVSTSSFPSFSTMLLFLTLAVSLLVW